MKWIFLSLLVLLTSCTAETQQNQSAIGKYIYLSPGNHQGYCILHIDRECASSTKTQEPAIVLMETSKLKDGIISSDAFNSTVLICPKCVDDKTFEQLKRLIEEENENE